MGLKRFWFLSSFILFGVTKIFSQCGLLPLGPVDSCQVSYFITYYPRIVIDQSTNIPYVAFMDQFSGKISVRKNSGTCWQAVGAANFANGGYIDLAIDRNSVPFIVFCDANQSNKASVMKFNGTNWVYVGSPGFSAGTVVEPTIRIDSTGVPYVAYRDAAFSNKASVMKYNGTNWVYVGGPGFSPSDAGYVTLVLNKAGTPIVAYSDWANGQKLSAKKFNGSSWSSIGAAGFSSCIGTNLSLGIDANDSLYVAFSNYSDSGKTNVMKFSGSQWSLVGPPDFNHGGWCHQGSLMFDHSNTPVMAIQEGTSRRASVITFNGTSWVHVGAQEFSASNADYANLAVDTGGILYVAFEDYGNNRRAVVERFNGLNWEKVGATGISADGAAYPSMAIDSNGVAYLAFQDYSRGQAVTVMKYNGASWDTVGNRGFSLVRADYITLALDPGGTPYVSFQNVPNNRRANVMRYTGSSWTSIGPADFSPSMANELDLAIDKNGELYTAYADFADSNRLSVFTYNGSGWINIGAPHFSNIRSNSHKLVISDDGTPVVAFTDGTDSNSKLNVMKFDGVNWIFVGSPRFTPCILNGFDMTVDRKGNPCVAFGDGGCSLPYSISAMTYDSVNGWHYLGPSRFGLPASYYSTITIDPNNTPYVAYLQGYDPSTPVVVKFDGNSWAQVVTAPFSWGHMTSLVSTMDKFGMTYIAGDEDGIFAYKLNFPACVVSNDSLCAGDTVHLYASGGSVFSWTGPGGFTSSMNNPVIAGVQPSSSGSYSVVINSLGCTSNSFVNIVVDTIPQVSITASLDTLCSGNTDTLTAIGAYTYTWSNGTSGASNIVTPSISGAYFVVGASLNGCVSSTASVAVQAQSGCVWPGDADDNLVVDNQDLLPIGVKFGQYGPRRSVVSNSWEGFSCPDWNDTLNGGMNLKYSDCNGDSLIGFDDTLSIGLNYGLSHPAKGQQLNSIHSDIYVLFSKPFYYAGDTLRADILVGDSTNTQTNFYGAAFSLFYETQIAKPGSEKMTFANSWVGNPGNNLIKFSKVVPATGSVHASLVRITHRDTLGFGKIGTFSFILKDTLPTHSTSFSFTNVLKTDSAGMYTSMAGGSDSVTVLHIGTTSEQTKQPNKGILVYPNPSSDQIQIECLETSDELIIVNALGIKVAELPIRNNITFDISRLERGIYFIQGKKVVGKFVKE